MPSLLIDGYKFAFFSADCDERPHFHVLKGGKEAKVWLQPVEEAWNRGYNRREMSHILDLARRNEARLMETWNEHCGNR